MFLRLAFLEGRIRVFGPRSGFLRDHHACDAVGLAMDRLEDLHRGAGTYAPHLAARELHRLVLNDCIVVVSFRKLHRGWGLTGFRSLLWLRLHLWLNPRGDNCDCWRA